MMGVAYSPQGLHERVPEQMQIQPGVATAGAATAVRCQVHLHLQWTTLLPGVWEMQSLELAKGNAWVKL